MKKYITDFTIFVVLWTKGVILNTFTNLEQSLHDVDYAIKFSTTILIFVTVIYRMYKEFKNK